MPVTQTQSTFLPGADQPPPPKHTLNPSGFDANAAKPQAGGGLLAPQAPAGGLLQGLPQPQPAPGGAGKAYGPLVDSTSFDAYRPASKAITSGDVVGLTEQNRATNNPRIPQPSPNWFGSGTPVEAPITDYAGYETLKPGPLEAGTGASEAVPYSGTRSFGIGDTAMTGPPVPAPTGVPEAFNHQEWLKAQPDPTAQWRAENPNATTGGAVDYTDQPNTSTARQGWNWLNRQAEGAPGALTNQAGSWLGRNTPAAANKPLTTYIDPELNPKLPLGDWANRATNNWFDKNLSPEVTNLANLDSSPTNIVGAAIPAARALRGAGTVVKAAPTASTALTRPGWTQSAVEFATGAAPLTNTARVATNSARAVTGIGLGGGGRVAAMGDAIRAGVRGGVGTLPPMITSTLAPAVARGEGPGTPQYDERMRDNPTARELDFAQGRDPKNQGTVDHLLHRLGLGPQMAINPIRNAIDGGNRITPSSYYGQLGRDLGDLGDQAVKNPGFVAERAGDAFKDKVLNPVGIADQGQTDYEGLRAEFKALQSVKDPAEYQKGFDAIKARAAQIDYPGRGQDSVANGLLRQQAYEKAKTDAAGDPQALKWIDEYRNRVTPPQEGATPGQYGPTQSPELPVPTKRDTESAYTSLGLTPLGSTATPRTLPDETKAKYQQTVDHQAQGYADHLKQQFGDRTRGAMLDSTLATMDGMDAFRKPGEPSKFQGQAPATLGSSGFDTMSDIGRTTATAAQAPAYDALQKQMPGQKLPDPQVVRSNITNTIAAGGGTLEGALSVADKAPPPPGFESYWKGLDSQSKMLAIGGLSVAAIMTLKRLFASKDDEEGGSGFLSTVLPLLGVGAAAWGLGGGTVGIGKENLPSMAKYKELGGAFKANLPAGLASRW